MRWLIALKTVAEAPLSALHVHHGFRRRLMPGRRSAQLCLEHTIPLPLRRVTVAATIAGRTRSRRAGRRYAAFVACDTDWLRLPTIGRSGGNPAAQSAVVRARTVWLAMPEDRPLAGRGGAPLAAPAPAHLTGGDRRLAGGKGRALDRGRKQRRDGPASQFPAPRYCP